MKKRKKKRRWTNPNQNVMQNDKKKVEKREEE